MKSEWYTRLFQQSKYELRCESRTIDDAALITLDWIAIKPRDTAAMLMPQGGEPQNPLTYNSKRARRPGNRCRRNGSALRAKEKVAKKNHLFIPEAVQHISTAL